MTLAAFTEFSEEYANPRNLTAGSLKNKDPANSRTRALSFGAYDLLGLELATETEKFARLKLLGIPTVDHEFVDRDSLRPAFMRLSESSV